MDSLCGRIRGDDSLSHAGDEMKPKDILFDAWMRVSEPLEKIPFETPLRDVKRVLDEVCTQKEIADMRRGEQILSGAWLYLDNPTGSKPKAVLLELGRAMLRPFCGIGEGVLWFLNLDKWYDTIHGMCLTRKHDRKRSQAH